MKDFAIFILTHGRPNKQLTYESLKTANCTMPIYFVLDNTDNTIQEYIDTYGAENIIIFDKNYYLNSVDVGTNKPSAKCILYAKCAVEDIAKSMNLKYFVIADDDLTDFRFRFPDKHNKQLNSWRITDMDKVLSEMIGFLDLGDLVSLGLCEHNFFFAGVKNYDDAHKQKLCDLRIPHQFILRNIRYAVNWVSYFGEDDITAMLYNSVRPWYKFPVLQLFTEPIGGYSETVDGMAETYNEMSDFTRCMFFKMYRPDCVTIKKMYSRSRKDSIWTKVIIKNNAFPRIISGRYKKLEKFV